MSIISTLRSTQFHFFTDLDGLLILQGDFIGNVIQSLPQVNIESSTEFVGSAVEKGNICSSSQELLSVSQSIQATENLHFLHWNMWRS